MSGKIWLGLTVVVFAALFSESAWARACDVDADGDIDRLDILYILKGWHSPPIEPEDPRDATGDGRITLRDALYCMRRCDLRRCAVVDGNAAPVADAGTGQEGVPGDLITIDGSGSSDPDGDPLSFQWTLVSTPDGSNATLQDQTAVQPTLAVDLAGLYIVGLVVHDGTVESAMDSVEVRISGPQFTYDNSVQVVQTLTEEGGVVTLEDPSGISFMLEVPSGSIPVPVEFTLTRVESVAALPIGMSSLAAVHFGPTGLDFLRSASLTMQLPDGLRTGRPAIAFLSDDAGERLAFQPLAGTDRAQAALEDLIVSTSIPHFTTGGALEIDLDAVFPPPPAGADARTRAQHYISERTTELLNDPAGPDIVDDPLIAAVLTDWLENPVDGLRARAEALSISPNGADLTTLLDLNGEMNDFIVDLYSLLSGDAGSGLVEEVVDVMSELVAAYLVELKDQCLTDSTGAQTRLSILDVEVVRSFAASGLAEVFEDETFACEYDVTFTPDFKAAFYGEAVGFDYEITLQDGTPFAGSIEDIQTERDIDTVNLTVESIEPGRIIARAELLGLASLSVTIGGGPESTVELLTVPSYVATYSASGSGSSGGCIDPEDAGGGSGSDSIAIVTEQILSATRSEATLGFAGSGGIVTRIDLTVNLTEIEPTGASGSAFGSLDYQLSEIEDGEVYVTIGGGDLTGSVVSGATSNTFTLGFDGSDNWCSSVTGTMTMMSP